MDYNFFEPVTERAKRTNLPRLVGILAAIVVLGWLLVGAGANLFQFVQLRTQIDNLESASSAYNEYLAEVREAEFELAQLSAQHSYVMAVDFLAESSRTVTTAAFSCLTAAEPVGLTLDYMEVTSNFVSVSGIAPDLNTIAQFEYNLRGSALYEDPLMSAAVLSRQLTIVDNVEVTEESYNFNMSINIAAYSGVPDSSAEIDLEPEYAEDEALGAEETDDENVDNIEGGASDE